MTPLQQALLTVFWQYGGRCRDCGSTEDLRPHRRALVGDVLVLCSLHRQRKRSRESRQAVESAK